MKKYYSATNPLINALFGALNNASKQFLNIKIIYPLLLFDAAD